MSGDYLKLTAYFPERLRTENRFVADALLDLCDRSAVATSVLLRGIASFGPRHELRSDETLSLSEDTPVAVAAVDAAEKITGLAEEAIAMTRRGLVTLERARLVGRSVSGPTPGTAKLTVYLGRQDRAREEQKEDRAREEQKKDRAREEQKMDRAREEGAATQCAHRAVCEVLYRNGFAGGMVFLGVDGTAHGQRHRARFFSRNIDVPLMIIAIGTEEQVDRTIPEIESLLSQPLLTVERAQLCKRDGHVVQRPPALPRTDETGLTLWQKLTIHTCESEVHQGVPIHRAIVRRLFETNAASGATVLRGLWGFHSGRKPHGDRLFQLTRDVPVLTVVIDSPDRIAACFDIVDALTGPHGLITSEMVPAAVSIDGGERRGGSRLGRHDY